MNKRIFSYLGWIIAILVLLAAIAGAFGVRQAILLRGRIKADGWQVAISGWPTEATVGEVTTATLTVSCPWGVSPETVDCTPVSGWVRFGDATIERAGRGWGADEYRIELALRPFRPTADGEEAVPTPAGVNFSAWWGSAPPPWRGELAAVKVTATSDVEPGAPLEKAGKLDEAPAAFAGRKWIWIGAAVVAVLALLAALYGRKRAKLRSAIPPTPWEIAADEVEQLRGQVRRGHDLNGCLVKLTDVVRQYLEQRFALKSTRQTTVEFLHDLRRPHSPLSGDQQDKLASFLTAADLVKFAGRDADALLLNPALDEADSLIRETRPQPETETRPGEEEPQHV